MCPHLRPRLSVHCLPWVLVFVFEGCHQSRASGPLYRDVCNSSSRLFEARASTTPANIKKTVKIQPLQRSAIGRSHSVSPSGSYCFEVQWKQSKVTVLNASFIFGVFWLGCIFSHLLTWRVFQKGRTPWSGLRSLGRLSNQYQMRLDQSLANPNFTEELPQVHLSPCSPLE